ncbi:amidohydrolase family protein [Halovulum dunhuangense]|uniref:Amidohydrolase family protein n=1 Tax=Halovulum dunhuangense TaxID=1505036 RepID=A0A849L7E8_9RHOB|nr:amidohydrolase family protein [Halovulum dunhuangense]NNU82052.1 amidohydrolase family protein [Halovulum dunhuangense]
MCRLCQPGQAAPCPTNVDYRADAAQVDAAARAALLDGAHSRKAQALAASTLPEGVGTPGRRVLIKGGIVISMDDAIGNHAAADVLIEGAKIVEVAPSIDAPDAAVIDAAGKIVMPGFVDTHHHQFETALRSFLPDAILVNDGRPESAFNYYESMLQKMSLLYRPEDVYINEVFGSIAQLDAGVTTVMDVSQIHHSPEHSDATIEGLRDAGRRSVFGYFEGWGERAQYPQDAKRIRAQHFASDEGLLSMVMGGEIYLPGYETAWAIGRELGLPVALHVVGTFGMQPTFDELGAAGMFGPDNIFIHMTGMSEAGWKYAADAGAHVSLSVPIEMQMRHGMPPIQKALDLGLSTSLSTDVECTMTADFFTQMRGMITLQRMFANERALAGEEYPKLMSSLDTLRCATIEGARGLRLDHRTGSLTPGKEADIILLDAEAINVAPLNHAPGAVVTLMERTNVDSVMVAGQVKKWRGTLLGFDIPHLRRALEDSRDHLFRAADLPLDPFRA